MDINLVFNCVMLLVSGRPDLGNKNKYELGGEVFARRNICFKSFTISSINCYSMSYCVLEN